MENRKAPDEAEDILRGQPQVWQHIQAFGDSMALKCAVELRIPDIIHSHGGPVTLSHLASSIGSPNLEVSYLARVMRLLVRNEVFSVDHRSADGGEPVYGLTSVSRWLVQDSDITLAPMLLFQYHPLELATWQSLCLSVREGGVPFEKAHGCGIWEFASKNPDFNKVFNDAMACTNPIVTRGILAVYGDGFGSVGTLVDVGGGVGSFLAEIVKLYPHVKGINYDLPHVIETAPEYKGITHVGGNMFDGIPPTDAVILKLILHNWDNQHCVKILRNCRKAIDGKQGKVIIVDTVLEPEGEHPLDGRRLSADLMMMTHCLGGQERTKLQWQKLLQDGGFSRHKFITVPAMPSVIEAYAK